MQLRGWDLDDRGDRGCQTFFHGGPVPVRGRGVEISPPAVGDRRCPAVARREKNAKEPVLLHDSPAANTIDLVNVSVLIFAAGESCNSTGYIAPAVARTPLNAGRQLPTAISQRHGHGRAPDHHGGRSVTPDRHGRPGPTPVAASPHKRHHRPNPKFGRFWMVFTCTHS